jgi:hypothetical protein
MTQIQHRPELQRTSTLSPGVTAAFGFTVYAIAMIAGNVFEVNLDSHLGNTHPHTVWESATTYWAEFAIGLVGVAIAVWAGRRVWGDQPSRVARTALILAAVAAVTYPVFWAGWPSIFGAVAVGLALESRRRVGSFSVASGTAVVLGAAAFVAGALTCLLG